MTNKEKNMEAYLGDKKLKTRFVGEVKKHREADQIIQGTYGQQNGKWKGCAVACSLRSLDIIKGNELETEYSDHERYESELGIPEWLARVEDTIFEGLPQEKALDWPLKFAKAIPVGANLEPVKWQFCAFILNENIERVITLNIADDLKEQVVSAIRQVLSVHETAIKTGKWDESAAWSAAWSARSAAESAESAAWSARSAAWSARSAAESAESARSAAESARSAAYEKYADKLIKLLKAAK
jgi:hypothetical protein